jgi:ectoine hydroxylase-related dioxygenase (phytanoyl-CoA dioxygenase family)
MRISDDHISEFHDAGFVVVPNFLSREEVAAATQGVSAHFPSPEEYNADPDSFRRLRESQFSGIDMFPWRHLELNRLTVHPGLLDAVRRILACEDIRLYKAELWGKFAGAINYDQAYHRDFLNHMLVVPDELARWRQITTFLYLTDVDRSTGGTAIVPRRHTEHIPLSIHHTQESYEDVEVFVQGRAGTLLIYSTDIFHRATDLTKPQSHRIAILSDFKPADMTWGARHAWPARGNDPLMAEFLSAISAEQRTLFDFPAPGHPYWNEQTIRDTGARYPDMDMTPYE